MTKKRRRTDRFGKGRATPSRKETTHAAMQTAIDMRQYLRDRLELAQKRKAVASMQPKRVPGHGKTTEMREIKRLAPQRIPEADDLYKGPTYEQRRAELRNRGIVLPNLNTPYVNPARDLKKDRNRQRRVKR